MKKLKILLSSCIVAMMGFGCVALSACGSHEHVWDEGVTTKRATCSEEGIKILHCTVSGCNETMQVSLAKTDHKRGEKGVDTATCEEGGHMVYTCTECGETFEGEKTTKLGHDMVPGDEDKKATCLEGGTRIWKCSRCDKTETRPTEKLEHDYQYDEAKSTPATCNEEGENVYTCVNGCNDSRSESVRALGHDIKDVSRKEPSFTEDGYVKGHCSRCDKDINEKLPMLVDGSEMEFTYRIMNGDTAFFYSSMTIEITDENGNVVAKGKATDVKAGKFVVKLEIHPTSEYTINISNISCYRAEKVKATPFENDVTVNVEAHIFEADDLNAPSLFQTGMMAQDFILTDIDGETIQLDKLLEKNKIVVLDLFYSTCKFCIQSAPGLEAAYQLYKDKGLAVVGISTAGNESYYGEYTDDSGVKEYRTTYGITFPLIYEELNALGGYYSYKFDSDSVPTAVFIDHTGIIRMIAVGYHTQADYEKWFKQYTDIEYDDLKAANAIVASVEEEKDSLSLSFERGEYYSKRVSEN